VQMKQRTVFILECLALTLARVHHISHVLQIVVQSLELVARLVHFLGAGLVPSLKSVMLLPKLGELLVSYL
jgi:hypothetical protein